MINVVIELGQSSELRSIRAVGHANAGSKGNDIVCSAVSVLLRTVVLTIFDEHKTLKTKLNVEKNGQLEFDVLDYNIEHTSLLKYASDFLQKGMKSIQQERPESLTLTVNTVYE